MQRESFCQNINGLYSIPLQTLVPHIIFYVPVSCNLINFQLLQKQKVLLIFYHIFQDLLWKILMYLIKINPLISKNIELQYKLGEPSNITCVNINLLHNMRL